MPWASWESVGDQSDYVVEIEQLVEQYVPTIRQMLPALYFNSFYDKFVASFLPKFLQVVLKCKRINEMGTQQLLLDTYGLKTMTLQLPVMGMPDNTTVVPARYTKLVTNELSRIETALKLIGTPNDMLVQSFNDIWEKYHLIEKGTNRYAFRTYHGYYIGDKLNRGFYDGPWETFQLI